jgi:hypothetical protein
MGQGETGSVSLPFHTPFKDDLTGWLRRSLGRAVTTAASPAKTRAPAAFFGIPQNITPDVEQGFVQRVDPQTQTLDNWHRNSATFKPTEKSVTEDCIPREEGLLRTEREVVSRCPRMGRDGGTPGTARAVPWGCRTGSCRSLGRPTKYTPPYTSGCHTAAERPNGLRGIKVTKTRRYEGKEVHKCVHKARQAGLPNTTLPALLELLGALSLLGDRLVPV